MKSTLFVARTFPPAIGGAETLNLERCKAQASNAELLVLAPAMGGAEEVDAQLPFRVHRWPHSPSWPRFVQRIALVVLPILWSVRLCLRNQFEVVECSQPLPVGLAGLVTKLLLRRKLVVWALGNDVVRPARSPIGRLALRLVLYSADRIVAISEYTKVAVDQLSVGSRRLSDRTVIIHPRPDLSRFSTKVDPTACRRRYGLDGSLVLLTVARVVKRKGIDEMIKALPIILKDVPTAKYVVVGEGPQVEEYRRLAEELGVVEETIFVGRVSDTELPVFYAMADVVVLLSNSSIDDGDVEGYGIVLCEAGASGKPVIGASVGGITDAVVHGVTGYLVDPRDTVSVAQLAVHLLSDAELRKKLGEAGRELARRAADWSLLLPD